MAELVRTQVVLRRDQHEFIYEAAHRKRISMSEWIRQAIDKEIKDQNASIAATAATK